MRTTFWCWSARRRTSTHRSLLFPSTPKHPPETVRASRRPESLRRNPEKTKKLRMLPPPWNGIRERPNRGMTGVATTANLRNRGMKVAATMANRPNRPTSRLRPYLRKRQMGLRRPQAAGRDPRSPRRCLRCLGKAGGRNRKSCAPSTANCGSCANGWRRTGRVRKSVRESALRDTLRVRACLSERNLLIVARVGLWRSLVARPSGGRKVAGSSPASPTKLERFESADR